MWNAKKMGCSVLIAMALMLLAIPALAVIYQDGVYHDKAEGYNGDVIVKVVVRDGKITTLSAEDESGEKPEYFTKAEEGLRDVIIEKQSIEGVDAISGATGTSDSILKAMEGVFLQTQYIGDEDNGDKNLADTPVPSEENALLPSVMPEAEPSAVPTMDTEATEEPATVGNR